MIVEVGLGTGAGYRGDRGRGGSDKSDEHVIVCMLQISSHLARHSEKHFEVLQMVFTPLRIVQLLSQRSAPVRAKCCNLIGNLCRHSSRFYPILASFVTLPKSLETHDTSPLSSSSSCSPLSLLTACCADEDASTRKFACFAVGNAAFHCEELYPSLSCCIPLLSLATESEADEKTRANAAGAIGICVSNYMYVYICI